MITSIKDFYIYEASKKTEGTDLFVVNLLKNNKDLDEEKLKNINKYCDDFSRVFQICEESKDYNIFNNQAKLYNIEYKDELSLEDVPLLFNKIQQDYIINKIQNIPNDFDIFQTITGEVWVYIENKKWLLISNELYQFFKSLQKQKRKITLIGEKSLCNTLFHILFKLNIDVEYNFEFIDGVNIIQNESLILEEFKYVEDYLDYHNNQSDIHMDLLLDDVKVAYADYSLYLGKIHIKMIESIIKNKGYGLMIMRELARLYGYENIERNQLTPDGMKMRQKLDKEFNFDYNTHLDSMNKHLNTNVLKYIRIKHPIVADFMSDIFLNGYKETWDKWLAKDDFNDINDNLKSKLDIDFNDISDACEWFKNSPTNTHNYTEEVPEYIKNILNKLYDINYK